jgi:hypothetical protein
MSTAADLKSGRLVKKNRPCGVCKTTSEANIRILAFTPGSAEFNPAHTSQIPKMSALRIDR